MTVSYDHALLEKVLGCKAHPLRRRRHQQAARLVLEAVGRGPGGLQCMLGWADDIAAEARRYGFEEGKENANDKILRALGLVE